MNFLSHYYIDNIKDNHYYNAGLTLPDLLGFHKGRVRLNEKVIETLKENTKNPDLLIGMSKHLKLDKEFHTSDFFKKNTTRLQEIFMEKSLISLSHFNAHIQLEMIIDKYILHNNEGIDKDFYNVFKNIDFEKVVDCISSLERLNKEDMVGLLDRFSKSTYIGQYTDLSLVIEISNIVSKKFNTGNNIDKSDGVKSLEIFYYEIENEIKVLLNDLIGKRLKD